MDLSIRCTLRELSFSSLCRKNITDLKSFESGLFLLESCLLLPLIYFSERHPGAGQRRHCVRQSAGPGRGKITHSHWMLHRACYYWWKERQRGNDERSWEPVMGGLSHLLAAVESLTFLPSKEAKCCSRASRRLLGACRDRKHTVSKFLRHRGCRLYRHQDHNGVVGNQDRAENTTQHEIHHTIKSKEENVDGQLMSLIRWGSVLLHRRWTTSFGLLVTHHWSMTAFQPKS